MTVVVTMKLGMPGGIKFKRMPQSWDLDLASL